MNPKSQSQILVFIADPWIQLLRLSGDFSIDEIFVPEFEDGLLDALQIQFTAKMALTFVAKTILNGNQNESQKAHQILVNFLCSGTREPTQFDVRLLNQVHIV